MEIFLAVTLTATLYGLFFSVKKNIELLEKIENLGDAVYRSLDVLEEQHAVIEKKTKIEVFSDEPVVRELVRDMIIAKNSVMEAAKILDESLQIVEEIEEKDE